MPDLLQNARNELVNGTVKKGHPFRYFTLATQNGQVPALRTVVLRKVQSNFVLVIYTDSRSRKIVELGLNPIVSVLFYHPVKLLQISISGRAKIILKGTEYEEAWNSIPLKSRKDYTTIQSPSRPIKSPDAVSYDNEVPNFALIKIIPETIEYLQLKRPNHLRALFTKNEKEEWEGSFLCP